MAINKSDKLAVMQKEHGYATENGQYCGRCCNCQKHPKLAQEHICIAFGYVDHFDCTWKPDRMGCGLFNRPFLGLSPRYRPLVEVYGPRPPRETIENKNQISLFQ